jgi:hypothetical protein
MLGLGHVNPNVTLTLYTHGVRVRADEEAAIEAEGERISAAIAKNRPIASAASPG